MLPLVRRYGRVQARVMKFNHEPPGDLTRTHGTSRALCLFVEQVTGVYASVTTLQQGTDSNVVGTIDV
jgi:hypothetical protein